METNNKKLRMNISMAQEVKDWLDQKARDMGMSSSAYISMLVSQSRQQEQALGSLDLLKSLMAQMNDKEDIEDKKHDPNKKQRNFDANMIEKGWDKI